MALYKQLLLTLGVMSLISLLAIPLGFTGTTAKPIIIIPKAKVIQKAKPNPVVDPAAIYKKVCGECHMAYPPEFLPSGSWEKLLGSMEKHFENAVAVDIKNKDIIEPYLKKNGAESSKAKIPQKIMQSLAGNTPLRITEVPYIKKKHRSISPEGFQRKPIGSFTNCRACHLLADNWVFNKQIVVPPYEGTPKP